MIKPTCRMCHDELQDYGGILLSPPHDVMGMTSSICSVVKSHLCKSCYDKVDDFVSEYKTKEADGQ